MGVPFLITTDYKWALEHKVVLVYPMISGSVLSQEALQALAAFPRQGGTLIGVNVLGGGLNEVFGFSDAIASKDHSEIHLDNSHPLISEFNDPKELVLRINKKDQKDDSRKRFGTHMYTSPTNKPLAVYDNGKAAIIEKPYSKGKTYAFGIDIGFVLLKGYNFMESGMADNYVNAYEPMLDVFLRLIKKIYLKAVPHAILLDPVPFNKSLSVMITHDVDYNKSMGNSLKYAEYEKSQGIKATYFIQTKYIRDWNDKIFYDDKGVNIVKQLEDWGMEVASHSVSHSLDFDKFPLGDGNEQYPAYRPVVKSRNITKGGTIMGELRVSKFLLDSFLKGEKVTSFRSGFLRNPRALPQALKSAAYRFNSSVTANKSLTHLPFQLNHNRGYESEVGIYEFPITIEDEHLPKMGDRLPQALALAKKISRYGGIYVVLIHPNILDHKFEFLKGFIPEVRDSAWFGTVSEFGNWWSARDNVELDVFPRSGETTVRLDIPTKIKGLTLNIPESYRFVSSSPENLKIIQHNNSVVIEEAQGPVNLVFSNDSVI